MSFGDIVKRLGKVTADNSPAILTAVGAAGVVTTAYLAAKASFKAARVLEEHRAELFQMDRSQDVEAKEVVQLTWKLYLPAAGSLVLTIASIIAAQRIGMRRTAALAATYAISEKAWLEYRDKVIEKIGDGKEREIRDEIAQDRVNRKPLSEVVVVGDGTVLCYESFTGRYFLSDLETLKKAQNDTNYQVLNDYYASLTDFYNRVGLDRTSNSDEVGWNSDRLLELLFSATITEGGKPCIVMDFHVTPIRDFYRIN